MFKTISLSIILLAISIYLVAVDSSEVYFKFNINSHSELEKLTGIISIDNVIGNEVFAYANQSEFEEFQKLGYLYEILPNPSTLIIPEMASSLDQMREWDYYPTYEAYVDIMYQFQTDYPDICSVYNLGFSVEGREILVAHISDNVMEEENEPEFFYTGQMHGDELVTYILLLRLIDYLTENYDVEPQVTNLVNNVDIFINPLSNPDGTYAGGNHTVWGATRYNANYVDLNRNFPDPEDGLHPDGNEWQVETIIMMDFAQEHSFVLSSNLHSGTEVINYPWDTWAQLHADDDWWQEVSHTYANTVHNYAPANYMNGFNNGITNGYAWYTISGGRQDYMNYFHYCREMTLELSDVKLLPENQLNAHWDYNRESLLLYMEECLYGIRGVVTDSYGQPIEALITVYDDTGQLHDFDNSEVFTDPDVGDYHRMIAPGTYGIEISAYGYITQMIEDILVTDSEIQVRDFILIEAPTVTVTGTVTDVDTGFPIENAIIEILDAPIEPVMTNSNGEYIIENVVEGTYNFRVTAVNYTSITQEIAVSEENCIIDFELFISNAISFETGVFDDFWTFAGDADWYIDSSTSFDGIYSARSGVIGSWQSTSILVELNVISAGEISFWKKVSCEDDPNNDWDYFAFYIDGVEQDRWDGEIDWSEEIFPVDIGNHIFEWKYLKDGNVNSGQDCAWIDYVIFPQIEAEPELEVNPTFFNKEMYTNEIDIEILTLTNTGGSVINYNIGTGIPIDWLSFNFTSGSLEAGENNEIEVTFDTTNLTSGEYTCNIIITDDRRDLTTIPVTLLVASTNTGNELIQTMTKLIGNYPNPFNPETTISFFITAENAENAENAEMIIFNIKGQMIKSFSNLQIDKSPNQQIIWNGRDENNQPVSSGIYFYKLKVDDKIVDTKKCLLLK